MTNGVNPTSPERPDYDQLYQATLDFIEQTAAFYVFVPVVAQREGEPLQVTTLEQIKNSSIDTVNACLVTLGGLNHFYEDGASIKPARFLKWKGLSEENADSHIWEIVEPSGRQGDITIASSVIDEMRNKTNSQNP